MKYIISIIHHYAVADPIDDAQIFLDVIEKLNILVAANGTVLRSEILGALKMKSFLSGTPIIHQFAAHHSLLMPSFVCCDMVCI